MGGNTTIMHLSLLGYPVGTSAKPFLPQSCHESNVYTKYVLLYEKTCDVSTVPGKIVPDSNVARGRGQVPLVTKPTINPSQKEIPHTWRCVESVPHTLHSISDLPSRSRR